MFNAKKSAVLSCYLSFFSCLSEKISFLFACFPKYIHLCNAIQLRYLQSNITNNQAINPVTVRFTKSVTS